MKSDDQVAPDNRGRRDFAAFDPFFNRKYGKITIQIRFK